MKFNEARKIALAIKESEAAVKEMVGIIGTMAVNHFVKSFRNQGFTDESLERWKPRKGKRNRGRGKKNDWGVRSVKSGRAILVKTGALRRSIRKVNRGTYAVRITSDLPYAFIHNEGAKTGYVNISPFRRFRDRGDTITEGTGQYSIKTHKEGKRTLKIKAKEHVSGYSRKIRMPKRQFVGYSAILNRAIIKKFNSRIKHIFTDSRHTS